MTIARQNQWNMLEAWVMPCFCGVRHSTPENADRKFKVVQTSLLVVAIFGLLQWTIGHWSSSLTIQADAGHLLSDGLALGITLLAISLAKRPASGYATFGHQRLEILAALLNGLSLLGIAVWIIYESWARWQMPQNVLSQPMLFGAFLGLGMNGFNLLILSRNSRQDLNLRAVLLHTVSDFVSSIGALIAGISIHLWHCLWIDTCVGFMVAGLTILSAIPLLKDSLAVFLEYAPSSVDRAEIEAFLLSFSAVEQVEAFRLWALTQTELVICLKLRVQNDLANQERDQLIHRLQQQLQHNFQIHEVIVQLTSSNATAVEIHPLFRQSLTHQILP